MSTTPTAPKVFGPDGKPARTGLPSTCPQCGAGKDKRQNTSGFGGAVSINCRNCGHHYEGATEC